jgi:hypothetical protein
MASFDKAVPPADEHFVSLLTYLNHLVRQHGIKETPSLWRADREELDQLHQSAHIDGGDA